MPEQKPTYVELQIGEMQTLIGRILDHHDEFKACFRHMDSRLGELLKLVHNEKTDRIQSAGEIKAELHDRISKYMFTFLGGCLLFIGGIVTWNLTKGP